MALPKRRRTRSRVGSHRAVYRLWMPTLGPCPQCHNPKRSHRVCPVCGYYQGREVFAKEVSTAP